MKKAIHTALITGAGSGIGQATAQALSSQGAATILLGRDLKKLVATQSTLQSPSELLLCDLTSIDNIEKVGQFFKKNKKTLDLLVNNAGVFSFQSFQEASDEEWVKQWHTNFLGPVRLTKTLLPFFNEGASIINVGSTLGISPIANTGHYSSSKAALQNWTQALALELAPKIRVNAISPGLVQTAMNPNPAHDRQPMQRMGQPSDIADAIVYMAGAEWMTGSIVPLDGGISLL